MSSRIGLDYSLDVLVDGSEESGPPTLFVSVLLRSDPAIVKARYALGLGDLLCRAAADQRYKLQHVRAVFVDDKLQSLPSLLDVLHQAGRDQVTIVSSFPQQKLESLIQTVHPYKQHPLVHTCQVPNSDSGWWNVYQDEYILVHATRRSGKVLYLYTLFSMANENKSLLFVPSELVSLLPDVLPDLPMQEEKGGRDDKPLALCAIVFVCETEETIDFSTFVPEGIPYYFVAPTSKNLLIRAQLQSRFFNEWNPNLFPLRLPDASISSLSSSCCQQLSTGTSLMFSGQHNNVVDGPKKIDRLEDIRRESIRPERQRWMDGLSSFCPEALPRDENEISLEDDDDTPINETTTSLQLLVLGTGCAAPSPYRGASGYALLFPNDLTVVLEVGEGFVTQWHRHANGRSLDTIQLIWISHAHLDHYGGIVHLLKCIYRARYTQERSEEYPEKRRKLQSPYLVAGKKILEYLQHVFDRPPNEFYRGVEHSDRQQTSMIYKSIVPIAFWEDIRVDHSCHQAYGFIAGFLSSTNTILLFCFSGDTTPCIRLTRSCQFHSHRLARAGIDFLLHEATFGDSDREQHMASSKKHSTIMGALLVAKDIKAKKTLLTHFSQRYDSMPAWNDSGDRIVGLAADGLLFKLA